MFDLLQKLLYSEFRSIFSLSQAFHMIFFVNLTLVCILYHPTKGVVLAISSANLVIPLIAQLNGHFQLDIAVLTRNHSKNNVAK
ncbi:TPA: hypothetical protein DEP21_01790 [Patescibacteria group bacterium]|nr:hypothetical protein [Candidatus Gracilibacteria bacterium]